MPVLPVHATGRGGSPVPPANRASTAGDRPVPDAGLCRMAARSPWPLYFWCVPVRGGPWRQVLPSTIYGSIGPEWYTRASLPFFCTALCVSSYARYCCPLRALVAGTTCFISCANEVSSCSCLTMPCDRRLARGKNVGIHKLHILTWTTDNYRTLFV